MSIETRVVVTETVMAGLKQANDRVASQGLAHAAYEGAGVLLHTAQSRIRAYATDAGELADSGYRTVTEADRHHATAAVGWNVDQAVYIEFGTGLYGTGPGASHQPITPKTALMLHWVDRAGNDHFARSVKGIQPKPFLRPAIDESRGDILAAMGRALTSALEGLA